MWWHTCKHSLAKYSHSVRVTRVGQYAQTTERAITSRQAARGRQRAEAPTRPLTSRVPSDAYYCSAAMPRYVRSEEHTVSRSCTNFSFPPRPSEHAVRKTRAIRESFLRLLTDRSCNTVAQLVSGSDKRTCTVTLPNVLQCLMWFFLCTLANTFIIA